MSGLQKPLLTPSHALELGSHCCIVDLQCGSLVVRGLELFSTVAACESSRFPYVTPINSLVLPSSDCWNLSLILNLVLFELKKFLLSTKESLSMSSTSQISFTNVIGINASCLQVSVPTGSRRGDSVSSSFLSRGH